MAWHDFFTGGAIKSIESIALEFIDTDKENAEAKAVMIKTLDPNGKMRRNQSNNVGSMYKFYLLSTASMILIELIYCMTMGDKLTIADHVLMALSNATDKMTALFVPITTLYGVIVTASFGVNALNVRQGKQEYFHMKIIIDSYQNNDEEIKALQEFLQSYQIDFDVENSNDPT